MIDMLNKKEVLRYLGCKSADDAVIKMIEECEEFLKSFCRPRYVYNIFDVKITSDGAIADGGTVFKGEDIKKHLAKSRKCVVMAATLGLEVDREIKRLEITSVTRALVLDACATAYIEQVCDEVQNEISAKYGSVNYRYSPGYGDFAIEMQKDILKLLDTQRKIGLTLSDGGMMIPSKSVTAVLGCVDNDVVRRRTAVCHSERRMERFVTVPCGDEESQEILHYVQDDGVGTFGMTEAEIPRYARNDRSGARNDRLWRGSKCERCPNKMRCEYSDEN